MSDHIDMRVHKSFLTEKLGPLPTWAWMLIGLGIAIAISVMRANKKSTTAKATDTSQGDSNATGVDLIGGNQRAPIVFQDYNTTLIGQPPAGGRTCPPVCPPPGACPGPNCPTPSGQWVTIPKNRNCGPGGQPHGPDAWMSTLQGIAQKLLGNRDAWTTIWNDPQNSSLVARRKSPRNLHAGDKIWVPGVGADQCDPTQQPCPPQPGPPPGPGPICYPNDRTPPRGPGPAHDRNRDRHPGRPSRR